MIQIIKFGEQNNNARTYLYTEVQELPKIIFCSVKHPEKLNWDIRINDQYTGAFAYLKMTDEGIFADVKPYSNEAGILFEKLVKNGQMIVPAGFGRVDEEGIVRDYKLQFLYLTNEQ